MLSTYFKENLQKYGIQVLNLERDYSRANRGQISTRIEAFLEMIA
ncbi:MAG: 2-hydroxyacyl-CoA dehydratase [Candidatus Lokiarchaeota archaeon]|jgi:benzoyl-CoA reductase/2-hydroxyglutaryl-CoA dehydratase subunit BcrC/BadD/HgdB|nr:2-hydroxyacyl-CoA dehydratase [Candidatus Lokiarchaeota archaeon]